MNRVVLVIIIIIIQHLFLRHISSHCGHSEAHCSLKQIGREQTAMMCNALLMLD